ncbi:MAG: hypothetical protein NT159_20995 [Proteobacteria bacterium]|nr:hypothetical protein [Pseudomonadota bacterium]
MNKTVLASVAMIILGGCAEIPKNMPLVFGESITVGIGIGSSAADQGMDFTLGVKTRDIAVIPVVAYDKDGQRVAIYAEVTETTTGTESSETQGDRKIVTKNPETKVVNKDSYSVLGQFGSTTDVSTKRVGLGKFFATGAAAQQLSEGFAECLKKDNCGSTR